MREPQEIWALWSHISFPFSCIGSSVFHPGPKNQETSEPISEQKDHNDDTQWQPLQRQTFLKHVNNLFSSVHYPRIPQLSGNQVPCISLLSVQGVEERREQEEVKDACCSSRMFGRHQASLLRPSHDSVDVLQGCWL